MTIFNQVLKLIEVEQINQNGQFIPDDLAYLEKLKNCAELIVHQSQEKILGYVFFYCNDKNKKFSYITLIGTAQTVRGKGIGIGLIQSVLAISKVRGFSSCRLEVRKENVTAMKFYERVGFLPIEDREDKLLMQIEI